MLYFRFVICDNFSQALSPVAYGLAYPIDPNKDLGEEMANALLESCLLLFVVYIL